MRHLISWKSKSFVNWKGRGCHKLCFSLLSIAFLSTFSSIYLSYTISAPQYANPLMQPKSRGYSEQKRIDPIRDWAEAMKCHLPLLDPFDPTILEYVNLSIPLIDCQANYPNLFRTNFESKLIQIQKFQNASCCYKTMERRLGTDSFMMLSKTCYPVQESDLTIPAAHEFIRLYCTYTSMQNHEVGNGSISVPIEQNYTDMFAFVPLKERTERRVEGVERNEDLAPDRLSVLILGLDAQSHMNFKRQMPISYQFLIRNLSAIGLNGYTKVGDNTFPNLVPLLTGLSVKELRKECWNSKLISFDRCPFIWKNFEQKGYRTSFAEDSVWMGMFNYEKRGFLRQPTDYYLNPFVHQMAKRIGHEDSGNSKLCYGPRLGFEVLLDYMVKTSVTFKDKAYFQLIWANSLFHDYLNYPQLGDEMLSLTLQFFLANGFLNKTLLMLVSDHGIRWGSIRTTYQGRIEERMPLAYFVLPTWFKHKYPLALHNLDLNANRLTTPFDLYETLKDVLDLRVLDTRVNSRLDSRGLSLFSRIPKSRSCKDAGIEEHWCVCNSMERISVELPLVKQASVFLLQTLNQLISNHSMCAQLKLVKTSSAFRKRELNRKESRGLLPFQITLITRPGDAIFEGTLYYDEKGSFVNGSDWELAGEISRLSLYAGQNTCTSDYLIQKYCFCHSLDIHSTQSIHLLPINSTQMELL